MVGGVSLPVGYVNLLYAAHEVLQFSVVKDANELQGNHCVEAPKQVPQLLFDARVLYCLGCFAYGDVSLRADGPVDVEPASALVSLFCSAAPCALLTCGV